MGGSPSKTRKITIDNDNPTSVIKVSEECVQRIRGHQGPTVSQPTTTPDQQMGLPMFYEPSLTSIQLRQENIKSLKDNDAYWDQRIANLQKNHEQIQHIMDQEYDKAMQEVAGNKGDDVLKKLTTLPCGPTRAKIIDCYKKNKHESMRCAKEVQEFAECVDKSTLTIATK